MRSKTFRRAKLLVDYFQNKRSGRFYATIKEVWVDSGRTRRVHPRIDDSDLVSLQSIVRGYSDAFRESQDKAEAGQ